MKHLESVEVKVKHAFPSESLLVCLAGDNEFVARVDFTDVYAEDKLILYGSFKRNKKWGRYFDAQFYREIFSEFWLAKWLKLSKHVSEDEILNILVDKKVYEPIREDLFHIKTFLSVINVLEERDVSNKILSELESRFKWKEGEMFHDPYLLLKFSGITFELVQELIVRFRLGDPTSSKGKYLLEKLLVQANQSGHLYMPSEKVIRSLKRYNITLSDIPLGERFFTIGDKVYLKENYEMEKRIAENIKHRLSLADETVEFSIINKWETDTGFSLANNQREAAKMALLKRFCVVTGGPGVGKTTVCKCITDLLGLSKSILMVAPTGRAAKRANESTGLPTSTIHRLLEYNGIRFLRTKENPIETDVLVIDESSMVDSPLLLALLEAIPLSTKMIFVGDVDQLPSVGPGQILKDLIESGAIPVTRLTEIFRQAADSPIITCAYAVNQGKIPSLLSHPDLTYINRTTERLILKETLKIAYDLYSSNDLFDVQVLIPMYKGAVGIDAVNKQLQNMLNPDALGVVLGDFEIREGDKVIQTRNDYEKGIYNGDVGIVTYCSPKKIKVRFSGSTKEHEYLPEGFYDLQLCYATTVHRSQGSEYKYVVLPVVDSYGNMLQKNLFYTGITRAKKKLWIPYQFTALQKAVRLDSVPPRYTNLQEFLLAS